ncbi:MAG: BadF/BadG/BcrA/BcrD ATPase family protein [Thermotogota bacterium]|nr:BadF/BadG/BcrA/BcrD ATPase family protein [Thermotogota bacterium]
MFFLGADIGGTKTAVVIANESGEILTVQKGIGSNYQSCGKENSFTVLNELVEKACGKAQIQKKDLDHAYFGVAGADLDYDFVVIKTILDQLQIEHHSFENDGLIALRSGTEKGTGILVTCGTGSISYGYNKQKIMRKGGFSSFFGERLGGYYVAGMIASAIIRGEDGRGPKTIMHELLKKQYSVTIQEMMKTEYPDQEYIGPDVHIALISTLYRAAHQHDRAALGILCDISKEVQTIVNAFRMEMTFELPLNLVLEGSVFKYADPILYKMIKTAVGDDYNLVLPDHDPVIGAVLFAMEKAGHKITTDIYRQLITTYVKYTNA